MTIVYFFGGLALLYVGGEVFVRSAAAIGKAMHLSPLVAGLTIIAFATSAPELAISLSAAIDDLPGLALGNVVGSNICNLALILGVVTIIKPAPVRKTLVPRDVLVMALTTLLVPGLLIDGSLGRAEGALPARVPDPDPLADPRGIDALAHRRHRARRLEAGADRPW